MDPKTWPIPHDFVSSWDCRSGWPAVMVDPADWKQPLQSGANWHPGGHGLCVLSGVRTGPGHQAIGARSHPKRIPLSLQVFTQSPRLAYGLPLQDCSRSRKVCPIQRCMQNASESAISDCCGKSSPMPDGNSTSAARPMPATAISPRAVKPGKPKAGSACVMGLLATIGLGQVRNGSGTEPPLVTAGDDLSSLGAFLEDKISPLSYSARDVLRLIGAGTMAAV
jgi:hypothetical protein